MGLYTLDTLHVATPEHIDVRFLATQTFTGHTAIWLLGRGVL